MKFKIFSRLLQLLLLMLITSSVTWAQTPSGYLCSVGNDSLLSSRIYEYDVYLQNTDMSNVFELATFQAGIVVNPSILNGGTITASFVAGSSQLVAVQRPISVTFTNPDFCIKLSPRGGPGLGAGTIIPTSYPGIKLIRIRLTNTADFGQISPNFVFNFTASPYNTVVSAYDQSSGLNTIITNPANHTVADMTNPILNGPITTFNVTGSGPTLSPVGLDGSQDDGVNYLLYKGSTPQGPAVDGTGSAITFGSQTEGTYTVKAHRLATYMYSDMSGNAIVADPAPTEYAVTGGGSYCEDSGGLPIGVANSETGVTYTLFKNNVAQVPEISGTGAAISFGNQLFGSYTVSGTNGGGTTAMTGTSIITENPALPASVSIAASPSGAICDGTSVTFTASPVNGGTPAYQWRKGGVDIPGATNSTYTSSALVNGDAISVEMTSSLTCATGSPDLSNVITMTVNPALPASVSIVDSPSGAICAGTSVTFTATSLNGGTPAYQWKKGGADISGATNSTYTSSALVNGDAISVEMTSSLTCATGSPDLSNVITMTVNPALPASVSIVASPSGAICAGTSVTFTATSLNGGTPAYQWKKGGVDISGATNSTYSSAALINGDAISVEMTSSLTCATGSPDLSNVITMTVNPALPASVSIAASPSGAICAGTSVTFTATSLNGGTPAYQWKKGGVDVSGATNSTYTSSALVNGDAISVEMTSSLTCATGSPDLSNVITMTVNPALPASVSIAASPSGAICAGTSVTFTATPVNGGTPDYQWRKGGVDISGATNSTYSSSALINGDAISVEMTSSLTCATGSPDLSNVITMTVNPALPASVSIAASPSGAICAGTSVTFTATPVNGGTPDYQWRKGGVDISGATNSTYSSSALINGDAISVEMTSSLTCATGSPDLSNVITMTVNPLPSVGLVLGGTGSICTGTGTNITVNASIAGTYYQLRNDAGDIPVGTPVAGGGLIFLPTGNLTTTTTYNVLATNGCGSAQLTQTETVTVNPLPSTGLVLGGTGSICTGTATNITVAASVVGTDYQLRNDAGDINIGSSIAGTGTSINLPTGNLTINTTFNVLAINGCGSAQLTQTETVTINPLPSTDLVLNGPGSICTGTGTNITVAASVVGTNYRLRNDAGDVPIGAPVAGTGASINLPTGNLTATTTFNVLASNGCGTAQLTELETVTVNVNPTAPIVGAITPPTCSVSTGSVILSGLPSSGWTLTRSPGGTTSTGTGSISTISSLLEGTYTYTVTNLSGCTSVASAPVVIPAQPQTPAVPVVGTRTHPTCTISTGSVILSGLPTPGTWTLTQYPGATTTTGTGSSTTISGLATGTYNYTITNAAGCTSALSANVVINSQPVTPSAPTVGTITNPTCALATGSVVLSGLPAGTWTINPGGISSSGASTTISGLVANTYNFTVTNSVGCISPASANVLINSQPATPAAPIVGVITQPSCVLATGSVALSGLPASGTWTLTRTPGSITTTGTGTSTTVTGLAASGSFTFTVTNAAVCTSVSSSNVNIAAQPASPANPTQTVDCSLGSGQAKVNVTGPLGLEYRLDGGTYQSTLSFTNVANGSHSITVRNASLCTTTGANFDISCGCANPPTLALSSNSGSTCGLSPETVSGNSFGGSATNVTITENGAGTVSPATTGVTPFAFTYTPAAGDAGNIVTITVTTNNPLGLPCAAATETYLLTVNPNQAAPTLGTITQPSCTVATGSVVLNGLPSVGTWTLTRTPGGTTTGSGTSTTISPLATGSYTYTVTNANGCISGSSSAVVINAQPATPTAPVVGTISPPTCTVSTGSVLLSGLPASGTWTLTRTPGGVITTNTGTSRTISGLVEDTYTYTVTNSVGCTSVASASVVIPAQPETPTAPMIGTVAQPTCAIATGGVTLNGLPATGTWILTRYTGGATTTGTGISTTITGLAANTYNYTVTNASGCVSALSSNVTINPQPLTPSVPSVGAITQPTCAVPTGSVVLNGLPSAGIWTINPGGVSGTGTSTTVTSLVTGTFNFTVTNSAGCISSATSNVAINAQPATPAAPIIGAITVPTCTVSTGSVALSGLPSAGTWTLTRSPGGTTATGTGTSTTISNLAEGTYTYTVTNSVGCISTSSGNVIIPAQPETPTAPVVGTITQPTCALATGSVALSGLPSSGTWTLTRTPGGTTPGTGISTTISGLSAGSYTYTVTNATGCFSVASSGIAINTQPATPSAPVVGAITAPTCTVSTGGVNLSGLPSSGTWTLTRTPGGVTTIGTGTSTLISSLAEGTYTYSVTNLAGCTSTASGNVVIPAQPETPAAPLTGTITQPTCATATGSMVLSGLPLTGTWTITRTPGGVSSTGSGATTTLSGIAAGSYSFTVTNAVGCISGSSSAVIINTQPATPSAPVPGVITSPTCTVSTGSVELSGLPSSGTWTLTRTPGGITTTGSGTNRTITGLIEGTYTFTVTNSSLCISLASANVVIPVQPETPSSPIVGTITNPTCTQATGSVILNGLPTPGTWTLTRYAGGVITTGSGLSTTISGLAAGTYNYTVTNASGCVSALSSNVTINAQPSIPSAPIVGTITQPTCALATGSVVLGGLPSTGTWIINPGANAGTGVSATLSSLTAGTHNFTVTNSIGCVSPASANVLINAQPATPAAPVVGLITQPTCTVATGSVVLSRLPSTGVWTITRSPGGTTTTGSGTGTTIAGLAASGSSTFTVTNAAGCNSVASASVNISAQPASPAIPTQTVDCNLGFGQAVVNVTGPLGLEYRLDAGTYQSTLSFSNVDNGSHSITVRNASLCTTTGAIFDISCGCVNPPTLALSSNSGSTCGISPKTISGNTFGGSATSVTITENGAGTVSPATSNTSPFAFTYTPAAGDAGNTVTITVNSNNPLGLPCAVTTQTYVLTVNPNPAAPTAGTITQSTCTVATGSVVLNGLPSAGTWTLTRTPGGTTTGSGASSTISLLAAGSYTFVVSNANGCVSVSSSPVVINAQPATPTAPAVGTITPPSCTVSTGRVILNGLPSSGTWTLTRTPGSVTTTGTGTSRTITGLVEDTYTYTVSNAAGCTSLASADVVIPAQPEIPTAPVVGTITQPSCATATGSVVVSGLPATGNWTLTRSPGLITTTGSGISTTLTGLTAGIYNYTVTNVSGCISVLSTNITINAQPATPSAPTVGTIIQPTCSLATGSVTLNGLPSVGTWTINPGNISGTGTSTTLSGLNAGTYDYTVTNSLGCISIASSNVVINLQPSTPAAPLTGLITQPTCVLSTGSVEISNLPSTGIWTLTRTPGGVTTTGTGTNTTISDLATGTYSYKVTNASGCISGASANIEIYVQPDSPASPTESVDCSLGFGMAVVTVIIPTGAGLEYRLNGGNYQSSTTFTNVTNGTNTLTVKNSSGCTTTGPSFETTCGCSDPPTITLSSLDDSICGLTPITVTGNSFGGSATSVTITTDGSGAVIPSSLNASPFEFTYNPGVEDPGTVVTITLITDNPLNLPCLAATAKYTVRVTATPTAPIVGTITQPTCSVATGSVELINLPTDGTWILTTNPRAGITTGTGTNTIISGLATGIYTFTVSSTNNSNCISESSANVEINVQPETITAPLIGSIIPPTCSVSSGSVTLNGLPSSGTWTLTRTPGGVITTGTGESTTISDLTEGIYTYSVTNLAGCSSSASENVVIPAQLQAPSAPTAGTITQPSCIIPAGSVELNNLPSSGTWTLTRYPGEVITTGNGTVALISGIPAGSYNFTVTNNVGCVSSASSAVVINSTPETPIAPVVETITPPNCTVSTGSVKLSGLPAGTWTLVRSPGSIVTSGTEDTVTISGLSTGTYTFTVSISDGCTSPASGSVVIPVNLLGPTVIITNPRPVCSPEKADLTLITITLGSTQGLTYTYWIDEEASDPYLTPNSADDGTYYIKGSTIFNCYDIKPVTVTVLQMPVANAGPDQSLEYLFETKLEANEPSVNVTGAWSVVSGTGKFSDIASAGTTVSNFGIGQNVFQWTLTNGVCPLSFDQVIVDLIIPSLITPNGDDKNEFFILKGIEEQGKTELTVFDRRGVQVYKNSNYNNDWNGVDYNGNPLPDDTYFYILKSENGVSFNSFIVIRR